MRQLDRVRCECGAEKTVTPTASPWEFDYQCAGCTNRGTVSWAHDTAPPTFQVTVPQPAQQELFADV